MDAIMPPSFKHTPLNMERPSIRLIRIHRDSAIGGQLQCDMQDAETDHQYTCLSYVWGSASQGEWILVNGQRFWVRRNLHNFLRCLRLTRDVRDEWLWIDALSIDQTADAERNHQVRQMGQIYFNARRVIAWFGDDELIARFIGRTIGSQEGEREFGESDYWDRAWITQEMVLARRLTFMAQMETRDEADIGFQDDAHYMKPLGVFPLETRNPQTMRNLRGRSLVFLMESTKYKICSEKRDAVFSLLALCGAGSEVKVDYKTPVLDLAKAVLRSCSAFFCLCSTELVAKLLGIHCRPEFRPFLSHRPFARLDLTAMSNNNRLLAGESMRYPRDRDLQWKDLYHLKKLADGSKVLSMTIHLHHLCSAHHESDYITLKSILLKRPSTLASPKISQTQILTPRSQNSMKPCGLFTSAWNYWSQLLKHGQILV